MAPARWLTTCSESGPGGGRVAPTLTRRSRRDAAGAQSKPDAEVLAVGVGVAADGDRSGPGDA